MHNSSRLDHFQPRSIQEITNLACSVETRSAPSRMAKCAADASIEGPEAPATELVIDETTDQPGTGDPINLWARA